MSSTTAGALRNDGAGWSRAVSALDRGAAFVDLNEEDGRPRSISSSKSSRSRCTLAKRSSRFFNLWTSGMPSHRTSQHSARSRAGRLSTKPAHFQIWRTITLGTYKGVDAYRDALDSARIKLGLSADRRESDESSLSDVYERARRVGLELCPAEVGPQLRLEYRNQPLGEALDIAMEPVALYSGDPTILTLANWGTGLILIGRNGRSES